MDQNNIAGFFLSGWYVFDNFAPFQVEWRDKLYPTAEHAYQAAHFTDTNPELAEKVRLTSSPREASDFANLNSMHDDPEWKEKRLSIMEEIVRCKLNQHLYVKQILIESKDKFIVEMNDDDAFWGWGRDHNGENHLGQIWMNLRSEIIAG
jgi:ribA/ribD-fused uncharacterized protein